jgi:hypothetical protein
MRWLVEREGQLRQARFKARRSARKRGKKLLGILNRTKQGMKRVLDRYGELHSISQNGNQQSG